MRRPTHDLRPEQIDHGLRGPAGAVGYGHRPIEDRRFRSPDGEGRSTTTFELGCVGERRAPGGPTAMACGRHRPGALVRAAGARRVRGAAAAARPIRCSCGSGYWPPAASRTRAMSTRGEIQLPDVPALGTWPACSDDDAAAGLVRRAATRGGWRCCRPPASATSTARPAGTYVWDFERNLTTLTLGGATCPCDCRTAADLVPPDLARRLLAGEPQVDAIGAAAGRRGRRGRADGHAEPIRRPRSAGSTCGRTRRPASRCRSRSGPGPRPTPVFTSRFLDVDRPRRRPDVVGARGSRRRPGSRSSPPRT